MGPVPANCAQADKNPSREAKRIACFFIIDNGRDALARASRQVNPNYNP